MISEIFTQFSFDSSIIYFRVIIYKTAALLSPNHSPDLNIYSNTIYTNK